VLQSSPQEIATRIDKKCVREGSVVSDCGRILPAHFFCSNGFLDRKNLISWQSAVERHRCWHGYEMVDAEKSAGGSASRLHRPRRRHADAAQAAITVDDCERVTRQLQHVLEVEAARTSGSRFRRRGSIAAAQAADYVRFAGEQVEVTLKEPFKAARIPVELQALESEGAFRLVLPSGRAPAKPGAKVSRSVLRTANATRAGIGFFVDEVERHLVRWWISRVDVLPRRKPLQARTLRLKRSYSMNRDLLDFVDAISREKSVDTRGRLCRGPKPRSASASKSCMAARSTSVFRSIARAASTKPSVAGTWCRMRPACNCRLESCVRSAGARFPTSRVDDYIESGRIGLDRPASAHRPRSR